jgi:hypothetical protein
VVPVVGTATLSRTCIRSRRPGALLMVTLPNALFCPVTAKPPVRCWVGCRFPDQDGGAGSSVSAAALVPDAQLASANMATLVVTISRSRIELEVGGSAMKLTIQRKRLAVASDVKSAGSRSAHS